MITFKDVRKLTWQTLVETFETDCFGFAKEAAYSFILSFFPMLLFATALFAILGRDYKADIVFTLRRVLPADSRELVTGYVLEVLKSNPAGVLWGSFIATILPATGLVLTFSKAFDRIYYISTRRSILASQGMAYALVFGVGVPLLVATVATAAGTKIEHLIARRTGRYHMFGIAWIWGRWTIIVVTVMLIAAILYRFAPSRQLKWRQVFPGAVLASVLWILATLGFGQYVANFGSYNRVYGSLGAAIVLLVWMYVTSLVFLIGAVFNHQWERHHAIPQPTPNLLPEPAQPELVAPTAKHL